MAVSILQNGQKNANNVNNGKKEKREQALMVFGTLSQCF